MRTPATVAGIGLFLATSVALAEPAGDPSFIPIDVSTAGVAPGSTIVERGDHLWSISEAQLETEWEAKVGADEVAPYWRAVIEANRDRIRSGDPDLIYPGEVILLPPSG